MLNEKHHAYIVLFYFTELADRGETGLDTFRLAVETYGAGRGRRMAARALRDGHARGLSEYMAYREWEGSPEFESDMTINSRPGHVDETVAGCPWAAVFASHPMGLACGRTYCAEIDKAVYRGFNPALKLHVVATQHDSPRCVFDFEGYPSETSPIERAAELSGDAERRVLPFSYHCAHLLSAFHATVENVMGTEYAVGLRDKLLKNFSDSFGDEALNEMMAYDGFNFLAI